MYSSKQDQGGIEVADATMWSAEAAKVYASTRRDVLPRSGTVVPAEDVTG